MTGRNRKKTKITCYALAVLLVTVLLIVCCSGPYKASGTRWNLSAIYNPSSSRIHPAFRVYHNTNSTSLLLVKLFPSELLFNQANPEGEFQSKVSVEVQAYEIKDKEPVLADSITYRYTIKQENVGRRFLSQIPLKLEMDKRYQLRVVTRDILRGDLNLRFIEVDKTNMYSEQNFNLLNNKNIPYFNNVMHTDMVYKVRHRMPEGDQIFIHYYKDRSTIPKGTYPAGRAENIYAVADTIYILEYSPDLMFSFSFEGIYRFRFDTNQPGGLVITNFGDNFPKIKEPGELIEPLAYITTEADYRDLLQQENKKLANDNFWLGIAETTGRARELIRIYYNRVYFSNYYFSNIVPGWKTDRGMIYIVYGPPKNIEKTANSETWIYYTSGAGNTINFTFDYEPNAFITENFVLRRSESHEWHWKEAVDSWRSGEIFLLD
ncbi:MAG: GWxTD domain-containing protein [Bacteroidales bacterium]|jgi:GWxTD domain-containing protein